MSSTIQSSTNESYSIELGLPHHLPDVLRIMRENFYHEETMFKSLCSSVQVNDEEMKRINEYFDGLTKSVFERSQCLIAIRRDTLEVVGAIITILSENPKTGTSEGGLATICATENAIPTLAKIYIDYLTRMWDEARLFERYPNVETMWEFYALAVDKNHRRLGLATDLMNAGITVAKRAKVSLTFAICTSIFSRKSTEKVGMKSVTEFDLSEYKDANGETVFKNTEPHNIVSVMVLKL